MSEFLQGTAHFFGTMAPIVQQTPQVAEPMAALYASFARQYNLGRQAEDALEAMVEIARQASGAPQDTAEHDRLKAEMQHKMAEFRQRAQESAARLGLDQQKTAAELDLKKAELGLKGQDRQLKALEIQQKEIELGLKGEAQAFDQFKTMAEIEIERQQQRPADIS